MLFNRFHCILPTIFIVLAFFGCSVEHGSDPTLEFCDGIYVSDFWEVLIRKDNIVKYGSIDSDSDGNADCNVPVNLDSEMTVKIFTGEIIETDIYANYDIYYIRCSGHTLYSVVGFLGDGGLLPEEDHGQNCIVPFIVQPIDGGVKFAQYYSLSGILADDSTCSGDVTCFENLPLARKNAERMDEPMFSTGIRQQ